MRNSKFHIISVLSWCRATNFFITNFPVIKVTTLEALESIFATKAVARQLALAIALETGMVRKEIKYRSCFSVALFCSYTCVTTLSQVTVNQVLCVVSSILSNFSSRSRLIRHLNDQQSKVTTQDEWMDLAERIDNIQGDDIWRSDPNCQLYERERIGM